MRWFGIAAGVAGLVAAVLWLPPGFPQPHQLEAISK
jgi:hypothetical protein